jgi:hypothetical protein
MRFLPIFLVILGVCGTSQPAVALFMEGERVPVDRVVVKLEARSEANPNDPEAYYALARVYYLAAATNAGRFEAFQDQDGTRFALPKLIAKNPDGVVRWEEPYGPSNEPVPLTARPQPVPQSKWSQARFNYCATRAVQNFEEAIARDPENPLYWLGYACMLEEIWNRAFGKDPALSPPEFQKVRAPSLRDAYAKALALGEKLDRNADRVSPQGHVSLEAARALVRLEPAAILSNDDQRALKEAGATIARFAKLPTQREPITPIVFTLNRARLRLDDFVSSEKRVNFDLRGYGCPQRWPWLKPSMGFLVWDPDHTGRITSARQLFGGYTFQLFWKNGYEALSVLDDDDNGQLAGPELDGVSAWFDLNCNGVSETEEVTPLHDLGVMSVATHGSGYDAIHPTCNRGIILKDGTSRQTWDWMVTPIGQRAAGN